MRVIAGCLLFAAACGGDSDSGGTPSPADAGTSFPADGATSSSGLTVTWAADPSLPGEVGSRVVVTSATFHVRRLEVIGDAGPSGTMRSDFSLAWSDTLQPLPITFSTAAPGLYSKLSLDIDGELEAPSYELLGLIDDAGTMAPFRIVDRGELEIDIDGYEIALAAGAHAQVPVRLDLGEVFADLTVAHFHDEGGVWTLDDADPYIGKLRDDLTHAFRRGP
jgi:hypothetical protein